MSKNNIILALVLITHIIAQDYSGYAGNYFQNGIDARSIAMGNALTAGTDLNYPGYFNPAEVASVPNKKLQITHQFLSLDRRQTVISFTAPLPPVGVYVRVHTYRSIIWITPSVFPINSSYTYFKTLSELNSTFPV